MVIRFRSRLTKLAALVVAVGSATFLSYEILVPAYVSWLVEKTTKASLNQALALDPDRCDGYYRLGLYHTFVLEDLDLKAGEEMFHKAVRCQPLKAQYWLALAAALEARGDTDEATAAASKASFLDPRDAIFLWRCGNLFLRAGRTPEALDYFHRVLEGAPEYKEQVFEVAWRSTADKELILSRGIPNTPSMNLAYLDYLAWPNNLDLGKLRGVWDGLTGLSADYPPEAPLTQLDTLMSSPEAMVEKEQAAALEAHTPWGPEQQKAAIERWKKARAVWNRELAAAWKPELDQAEKVWSRMMGSNDPSLMKKVNPEQALTYFFALLRSGRGEESVKAWDQMVEKGILPSQERHLGDNLVVNGGFEVRPLNGGLDWRLEPVSGVIVQTDNEAHHSGVRSLALDFEGLENLDYHYLWQTVPVESNTTYYFSAYLRSRALSTDSGPHFEVYDPDDPGGLHWETPDVLGTIEWTPERLEIRTGPATHLLIIRVHRKQAVQADRRIEGTLWVDDVRLSPSAEVQP